MSPERTPWRAILSLCAVLSFGAASACRTPVAQDPLAPELAAAAERSLATLGARAGTLLGLRASARTEVKGASGEVFSRQLLLVERPAQLRIEVVGLLGQRALVLATDGTSYDVFRAEVPGLETGPVHAGVLWEVAGVPLAPEAAVAVLLAAPALPDADSPREVAWDGASGETVVTFEDRSFRFDAAQRLRGYRWHPDGHDWVVARYDDWQGAGAAEFPRRIALDFPANGGRVVVALSEPELNPLLEPGLFRLGAPEPLSSPAEGDGG